MARDALADTNTEPLKNSSVIFRLLMLKHHRTEQKQTEKTSIHRLWRHWNDIQWRARMSLSDVFSNVRYWCPSNILTGGSIDIFLDILYFSWRRPNKFSGSFKVFYTAKSDLTQQKLQDESDAWSSTSRACMRHALS